MNNKGSRQSDLTGFAALLGESFSARIDLLAQIIQGAHYPSLGSYKERILAETIRNYLPKSLEVGTGFVLFPHENESPHAYYDHLNQSAFSISRQCDILVFDSNLYPPVFRDGDFVVLRPESIKAVIEVKGSINLAEVNGVVDGFIDFGKKWKTTQSFYRQKYQKIMPEPPTLLAMGWSISKRKDKPATNPAKVRDAIARRYQDQVGFGDLVGFPLLSNFFIYNEAAINLCYIGTGIEGAADYSSMGLGWYSRDGRFTRLDGDGLMYRDKDRTIASLLAQLHLTLGLDNFNRFFSYVDEIKSQTELEYKYSGMALGWDNVGVIE